MKQPDEWDNWYDRWFPTLQAIAAVMLASFGILVGTSLTFITLCVLIGIGALLLQLWYELNVGKLS